MPDYQVREPRITAPVDRDDAGAKTDDGYFQYDPYDPRAADAGGFGYGGSTGSAGGFGAGGSGPQTGEYGSQANYGAGPEFNARDGAATDELEWVGLAPLGDADHKQTTKSRDGGADDEALQSAWADRHVAHAPSHPGHAKEESNS